MRLDTDPTTGPEPAAADDLSADTEDSAEYHALELGAGRCVVLLHDLYSSHESFAAVIDVLAEDWRVVGVDLPGHGRSSRPAHLADIAAVAAELAAVLDEFGALPAALVGVGVGATIAVELAAARPADVTALVLVGAGLGAEHAMWTDAAAAEWLAGSGSGTDFVDSLVPVLHGERFFVDQPGRASAERERLAALDPADVAPLARAAAASGRTIARLDDVSAPVLFVAGEDDSLVAPVELDAVAARAGVEVVRVPWAGHSAALERPAEVAGLIADFLRER